MSNSITSSATNEPHDLRWRDPNGDDWDFSIKLSDATRCRNAGLDLLNPHTLKTKLATPIDVVETISEILRPRWEAKSLHYEDFADLLTGSLGSLELAHETLTRSLCDFFRRIGRDDLAIVVEKAIEVANTVRNHHIAETRRATETMALRVIEAGIQKVSANIDEVLSKPIKVGD